MRKEYVARVCVNFSAHKELVVRIWRGIPAELDYFAAVANVQRAK